MKTLIVMIVAITISACGRPGGDNLTPTNVTHIKLPTNATPIVIPSPYDADLYGSVCEQELGEGLIKTGQCCHEGSYLPLCVYSDGTIGGYPAVSEGSH